MASSETIYQKLHDRLMKDLAFLESALHGNYKLRLALETLVLDKRLKRQPRREKAILQAALDLLIFGVPIEPARASETPSRRRKA